MRWVTILAAGYALNQMLAHTDPARIPGLANPAPWRPAGARTAGLIQAGSCGFYAWWACRPSWL